MVVNLRKIKIFVFVMCVAISGTFAHGLFYENIDGFLKKYNRPFTMLDLGQAEDHIGWDLYHKYPDSVFVFMGQDSFSLHACLKRSPSNIVVLDKVSSLPNLKHLGECEHFDIVYLPNIQSRYGGDWKDAIDVALQLGDHLIISISADQQELIEYMALKNFDCWGETVANGVSRKFYIARSPNKVLKRKSWLRLCMQKDLYCIKSNFDEKQLIKPSSEIHESEEVVSWIPGINFCTFKMCNGKYPTSAQLKQCLYTIKDFQHTDWIMNNMIIQGTVLKLIDSCDLRSKRPLTKELFNAHLKMIEIEDPKKVEHYFWYELINIGAPTRQYVKLFKQLFPASSLVFDINTQDVDSIKKYLGYGAKVISCNPRTEIIDELTRISRQEMLFFFSPKLGKYEQGDNLISNMITYYGLPALCRINGSSQFVFNVIQTCSYPIGNIIFSFDINEPELILKTLKKLVFLGYTRFNVSFGNTPTLVLDDNPYIDIKKRWALTPQEIINELSFQKKMDCFGEKSWGFIYACYDQK